MDPPRSYPLCSTCASAVSQELLAPLGVARSLYVLNCVDTAGRARGLSGAPDGARGRRIHSVVLQRLDPDGWLVQSSTDTNSYESPAAQRKQRGRSTHYLSRKASGLVSISVRVLDNGLLMGGTGSKSGLIVAS